MASRQLTLPKLLIVRQTLNRGAGCAPARHQLYWFQRLAAVLFGDRAFAVAGAGARVWNSLPATLTSQLSLLMFRRQLKTLLFEQSFS